MELQTAIFHPRLFISIVISGFKCTANAIGSPFIVIVITQMTRGTLPIVHTCIQSGDGIGGCYAILKITQCILHDDRGSIIPKIYVSGVPRYLLRIQREIRTLIDALREHHVIRLFCGCSGSCRYRRQIGVCITTCGTCSSQYIQAQVVVLNPPHRPSVIILLPT